MGVNKPRSEPPVSPSRLGRALRRLPAPSDEDGLEYPETLLRYPTAAMFLLMRELFRIGQERMARASSPEEQMRFPHFAILVVLDEFGPASQRETSGRLGIDPSDLVGMVDWLEEVGFVERHRDERDRRRYRVRVTPAGRRALRRRARGVEETNARLLRGLDERERKQLHELLLRALHGLREAGAGSSEELGRSPGVSGSRSGTPRAAPASVAQGSAPRSASR